MPSSNPADVPKQGSGRSRAVGIALLMLSLSLLAAGLWWAKQIGQRSGREVTDVEARLSTAKQRGSELAKELLAIKPPQCPPGQIKQQIEVPQPAVQRDPPPALPSVGSALSLGQRALAERLEQATAMVLATNGQGISTGTGFFVSEKLAITNFHVVDGSRQTVLLASNALKSVRRATILYTTAGTKVGTPDFALLRMDEGVAPGFLDSTSDVAKLANVVAAGFPAVVVQSDPRFARLMAGDPAAAPDLNLTQGTVQSRQSSKDNMPLIIHTASISKGNSGGPLVDDCGRIVGVNTFINVDQSQSSKTNYAIQAQAMVTFLTATGNSIRIDERPCTSG